MLQAFYDQSSDIPKPCPKTHTSSITILKLWKATLNEKPQSFNSWDINLMSQAMFTFFSNIQLQARVAISYIHQTACIKGVKIISTLKCCLMAAQAIPPPRRKARHKNTSSERANQPRSSETWVTADHKSKQDPEVTSPPEKLFVLSGLLITQQAKHLPAKFHRSRSERKYYDYLGTIFIMRQAI